MLKQLKIPRQYMSDLLFSFLSFLMSLSYKSTFKCPHCTSQIDSKHIKNQCNCSHCNHKIYSNKTKAWHEGLYSGITCLIILVSILMIVQLNDTHTTDTIMYYLLLSLIGILAFYVGHLVFLIRFTLSLTPLHSHEEQ